MGCLGKPADRRLSTCSPRSRAPELREHADGAPSLPAERARVRDRRAQVTRFLRVAEQDVERRGDESLHGWNAGGRGYRDADARLLASRPAGTTTRKTESARSSKTWTSLMTSRTPSMCHYGRAIRWRLGLSEGAPGDISGDSGGPRQTSRAGRSRCGTGRTRRITNEARIFAERSWGRLSQPMPLGLRTATLRSMWKNAGIKLAANARVNAPTGARKRTLMSKYNPAATIPTGRKLW